MEIAEVDSGKLTLSSKHDSYQVHAQSRTFLNSSSFFGCLIEVLIIKNYCH